MGFKLKTSKHTEDILIRIEASENLPIYTLIKLAIALSLRKGPLNESDMKTDTRGREFNRPTVTGDADVLYKCLIELSLHKHLMDDEYFPTYIKAHIDRGAVLLDQEQRYGGDFLTHLSELEKGI